MITGTINEYFVEIEIDKDIREVRYREIKKEIEREREISMIMINTHIIVN